MWEGLRTGLWPGWPSVSPSPSSRSKELGHGVGAEKCAGQERPSRAPSSPPPSELPLRWEDVEMTAVEDFVVSQRPQSPQWGGLTARPGEPARGPPGPPAALAPAPASIPAAPAQPPLLEGARCGGRSRAPRAGHSAVSTLESSARGAPAAPLPARPEGGCRGARQRRGWEPWTWPPPSGRPPPRIPQPRPERPPLTGDAETPTAQGRRRCCGARRQRRPEGGRGAGGGTARETPRSVCPGPPLGWGSRLLPSPSSPGG